MSMKVKLTLERLDKNYRLLERRELESRSLLRKFIELLYVHHSQAQSSSPVSIIDITNTPQDIDSTSESTAEKSTLLVAGAPGLHSHICAAGGSGTGSYPDNVAPQGQNIGIVVGTGVNAVTPTDYALQTKVAHGRAATQLEFGGCEPMNIAFADPNGSFQLRRYFTNLSGAPITINEVGIYGVGTTYGVIAAMKAWPFCICRDSLVVSGPVLVNDTELLRVTYTIQITV